MKAFTAHTHQNRVAVVTGAARGIGGETAKLMASVGAKVAIGDVLEERGRQTVREIEASGGQALFVPLDVTSEASWAAAMDATVKKFGGLDILVNNAGIFVGKGVEDGSLVVGQIAAKNMVLANPSRNVGAARTPSPTVAKAPRDWVSSVISRFIPILFVSLHQLPIGRTEHQKLLMGPLINYSSISNKNNFIRQSDDGGS